MLVIVSRLHKYAGHSFNVAILLNLELARTSSRERQGYQVQFHITLQKNVLSFPRDIM